MTNDDIVTRLNGHAEDEAMLGNDWLHDVMRDAADQIERLRTERDQWRNLAQELRHGPWYEAKELYEQVVSRFGPA